MSQVSIADRLQNVNDYLWKAIAAMVEAANVGQNTIPGPAKTRPVLVRGKERIELFRRHDERLVFVYRRPGQWKLSPPLAHYGLDASYISGRRGIWHLNEDERWKFDQWASEVMQ